MLCEIKSFAVHSLSIGHDIFLRALHSASLVADGDKASATAPSSLSPLPLTFASSALA